MMHKKTALTTEQRTEIALDEGVTRRVTLRRQAAITAFAMLSLVAVSQSSLARSGQDPTATPAPQPPNAPSVPVASVTPTDTSALATTTAAGLDGGDVHDSTMWRIRKASDSSSIVELTTDSLVSYQGTGVGATIPLTTDTVYIIDASHHGSVSGQWSGYGPITTFTASISAALIVFASDFGTEIGATTVALTDGGRWNGTHHNLLDGTGSVVNASSEGLTNWPSTNALKIRPINNSSFIPRAQGWNEPAVGESLYFRWYVRVEDGHGQQHNIQPVTSSNVPYYFNITDRGGSDWQQWWDTRLSGDWSRYTLDLSHGITYRFELQIRRTATSTMTMHARTYLASNDSLIATDIDYVNSVSSGTMADSFAIATRNFSSINTLQAGTNGTDAGIGFPFTHSYQGAFAICEITWCGVYVAGEGN